MVLGKQRMGWRFKGKTPVWFSVVAGLLIADSFVHFAMLWTVSWWASPTRDTLHPYPLPFRDGVVYFVTSALGRYLNTWWIGIGLFLLLAVLLVLNRDQLERTL
jgi:hypothetical protein